jgi:hypothetical protein
MEFLTPSASPTAASTSPVAGSMQTRVPCSLGERRLTPVRRTFSAFICRSKSSGDHLHPSQLHRFDPQALDQLVPDLRQVLGSLSQRARASTMFLECKPSLGRDEMQIQLPRSLILQSESDFYCD